MWTMQMRAGERSGEERRVRKELLGRPFMAFEGCRKCWWHRNENWAIHLDPIPFDNDLQRTIEWQQRGWAFACLPILFQISSFNRWRGDGGEYYEIKRFDGFLLKHQIPLCADTKAIEESIQGITCQNTMRLFFLAMQTKKTRKKKFAPPSPFRVWEVDGNEKKIMKFKFSSAKHPDREDGERFNFKWGRERKT